MSVRRPARLVAVGDNCLDVYQTWRCVTVGGNALNVAAAWRARGLDARYLGAVGEDAEADLVLAGVAAAGLDPGDVQRLHGETGVTLLSHELGDRHFLLENFGVSFRYEPPARAYESLLTATWVHLGTNSSPDLVRRLVAGAVPFSVDVSTAYDSLPLDGVPLVFASCPEASPWTPDAVADALRAGGAHDVVVTRGRLGAHLYAGDLEHRVPVVPVDVVDTCGAGDSFIAEFVASHRTEGRGADESLRRAAAAASVTCGHVGGYPQEVRAVPAWLVEKYAACERQGEGGAR